MIENATNPMNTVRAKERIEATTKRAMNRDERDASE